MSKDKGLDLVAKEYAYNIYQRIPNYTLIRAKLIFKSSYDLVEKAYKQLVKEDLKQTEIASIIGLFNQKAVKLKLLKKQQWRDLIKFIESGTGYVQPSNISQISYEKLRVRNMIINTKEYLKIYNDERKDASKLYNRIGVNKLLKKQLDAYIECLDIDIGECQDNLYILTEMQDHLDDLYDLATMKG